MKHAHKIGAVFYILWGLLHIVGGMALIGTLRSDGPGATLAAIANGVTAEPLPALAGGAIVGVLGYYAWLIMAIGLVVTLVAIFLNWKNSGPGYWVNLALLLPVEIGLYVFLLKPGYMLWSAGGIGMTLFVLGAIFSTIGIMKAKATAT